MTALDPRVGEIETRADEAVVLKAARALRDLYAEEVCKLPVASFTKEARVALEAAHPALLAELRKAHEALARVEKVGRELFALSNTDDAYWTDQTRAVSRNAGQEIYMALRAAVAAANGDGE